MIAEVLAGISGAGVLAALGSTIYFAVKHARAVEHAANVQIAQAHVEGELTRATFEIETLREQLALSERRADAFEEVLADDVNSKPNADLGRSDLRSRLLRFAQTTKPARGSSDSASASAVPDESTATASAGT